MPELRFIPNVACEGEGLSDAGIETYRDNPFPAVARENSQNAHDARAPSGGCVRVVIDRIAVPARTLPGYDTYRATVAHCLAVAKASGTAKEVSFFGQAEKVLAADEIPVLRVADFGTQGLKGPCIEGKPFHALVKSSGISDKPDDTSGGSFGIGKSAVYSASDLQTVFYSTIYKDEEEGNVFLCQGKTKFRSFVDEQGEAFRSVGYWGEPDGFQPVGDPDKVPDWLRRDEIGTTVCSIAVRETSDWQREMVASLVSNFFSAIHAGKLDFLVDGDAINANTMRRRFDDNAIKEAAASEEGFVFARAMYECLTDAHEAVEQTINLPGVGEFRLRILVRDGLPKRVGIVRNGMYICDGLGHFGDRFARFPMFRDFVAIVEPTEESSNAWLRSMENPRHDELSPERLLEPALRIAAKRDGKLLAKKIREAISAAAKAAVAQDTDLEELSEFFAMDNEGNPDERGNRNVETFKVRPAQQRRRPRQTRAPLEDGEGQAGGAANGDRSNSGSGGAGGGGGNGETGGGTGSRALRKPLPLVNPRTIVDPSDSRMRRVLFTPAATGEARLTFESSGLSDPEPLALAGGDCVVTCEKDKRQEIQVRFAEEYDGPIEIISWVEEETVHEAS